MDSVEPISDRCLRRLAGLSPNHITVIYFTANRLYSSKVFKVVERQPFNCAWGQIMYKLCCVVFLSGLCCACSPKQADAKATEKPAGVLTERQSKTLEKANNTEETLNKAADDRLKAAEENVQEGTSTEDK